MTEADKPSPKLSSELEDQEWPPNKKVRVLAGSGAVLVVLALLLYGLPVLLGTRPSPTSPTVPTASTSILREQANSVGPDPFGPSISSPSQPSAFGARPVRPTNASPTTHGDTAALFSGTQGSSAADSAKLVSFLRSDPTRSSGWARAVGKHPNELPGYLAALTPVLLRQDTRVTEYGWRDGQPLARQAVLQSGTAVLVDSSGIPRARAAGANPLSEPQPVAPPRQFTGPGWAGFDPAALDVIVSSAHPVAAFTLLDPAAGHTFVRPVGTSGSADVPSTPPPGAPPAAASPVAAPPPTPPAPAAPAPAQAADLSGQGDDYVDDSSSDDSYESGRHESDGSGDWHDHQGWDHGIGHGGGHGGGGHGGGGHGGGGHGGGGHGGGGHGGGGHGGGGHGGGGHGGGGHGGGRSGRG